MSVTHPENNWLNSNIHGYFIFQGEYIELALKKRKKSVVMTVPGLSDPQSISSSSFSFFL